MLSYTDLQKGTLFILNGKPHEVLEYNFLRMQQRKPVAQTKIKNLITGKITDKTFRQNDAFQKAEISKKEALFIYSNRDEFWFRDPNNPKERFYISKDVIGSLAKFLKENLPVMLYEFDGKTITISLPIKIDYIVKESPPGIKGDTAQGGTKEVVLENGLAVQVPLFIESGDVVRVNTESGAYVERAEKGK